MNQEIVADVHYLEIQAVLRTPGTGWVWRLWEAGLHHHERKEAGLSAGSHAALFIV